MEHDLRRLGDAVRARREQLGLTQVQLRNYGGPSDTTLTKIEAGEPPAPSAATQRKLDASLGWPAGSAKAILEGGALPPDEGLEASEMPRLERAPQSPLTRRDRASEYVKKNEQLARAHPIHIYRDPDKRRGELALREAAKVLGSRTKPDVAAIRAIRDMLEDAELETLIDRLERLPKSLQLEVSAFVDDLLDEIGDDEYPPQESTFSTELEKGADEGLE